MHDEEEDQSRVAPLDAGSVGRDLPRRRQTGDAIVATLPEKVFVSGTSSEWWVCFRCWRAFYVPTTGYFGNCDDCGKPTQRWPADPNVTLGMLEWKRPSSSLRKGMCCDGEE